MYIYIATKFTQIYPASVSNFFLHGIKARYKLKTDRAQLLIEANPKKKEAQHTFWKIILSLVFVGSGNGLMF